MKNIVLGMGGILIIEQLIHPMFLSYPHAHSDISQLLA